MRISWLIARSFLLTAALSLCSSDTVNAQAPGNSVLYSARWDKTGPSDVKWIAGASRNALQQFVDKNRRSYSLTHLSGFSHQGKALFCAIMKPDRSVKWAWEERLTRAELNQFVNTTHRGWKLEMFNGYELGGQVFFAALVRDQPGSGFRWEEQMTQKQVNDFINVQGKGARLTHLSGFTVGGIPRFDAILSKQSGTLPWEEKLTQTGLQDFVSKNRSCLPVCINGYRVQGQLCFASFVDCSRKYAFHWEEATTFDKFQTINAKARQRGLHLSLLNGVSQ